MLKIHVEYPDSTSAQYEFDSACSEVVIGRDATCDVVIAEKYKGVSRRHCSIERKIGRYCLAVDVENPPYLDGRVIDSGWFLQSGVTIELIPGGPRLRFEVGVDSKDDPTLRKGTKVPTARDVADAARAASAAVGTRLTSHKRMVLTSLGALALAVAAGLVWMTSIADAASRQLQESVASKEELESLRKIIDGSPHPGADDHAAAVLRDVSRSVYMVVQKRGSSVASFGTCWVVDQQRGLLATNAHVADTHKREALFVRVLVDKDYQNIPVQSVTIHPGYHSFLQEVERCTFHEILGKERDCASLCPACDVAILRVGDPDSKHLGKSIPLADAQTLSGLSPGADVGYVGFPTEGAFDNSDAPEPILHRGYLCAITDFFHREVPPAEATLLQSRIPASGGGSGGRCWMPTARRSVSSPPATWS